MTAPKVAQAVIDGQIYPATLIADEAGNVLGGANPMQVEVTNPPGADRELVVTTYTAKNAFTGASVGDIITCTQIIDVTVPSTVSTIWRNQTTAADLAGPPAFTDLTLEGTQGPVAAQFPTTLGQKADAASFAVTLSTEQAGTKTNAASMPSGGVGFFGWLSAIYDQLATGYISGIDTAGNKQGVLTGTDGALINFGAQGTDTLTIANGATTSNIIDLAKMRAWRLIMPAAVTGTTFSVYTSADGVTASPAYDEYGTAVTVTVGTSRSVALTNRGFWDGVRYFQLVGSAQGQSTSITVVKQP